MTSFKNLHVNMTHTRNSRMELAPINSDAILSRFTNKVVEYVFISPDHICLCDFFINCFL
jgi:hypothetical protein